MLGGVPGDLAATAEFLDGSLAVAFALMAAIGLDAAYPELNLENYLNPRGQELSRPARTSAWSMSTASRPSSTPRSRTSTTT